MSESMALDIAVKKGVSDRIPGVPSQGSLAVNFRKSVVSPTVKPQSVRIRLPNARGCVPTLHAIIRMWSGIVKEDSGNG
jgi:hypothetical protein